MGSTKLRSFIKGVCWETLAFIITTALIYFFYNDLPKSIKVSLIITGIKIIFFYAHERTWKKIKWGKIK